MEDDLAPALAAFRLSCAPILRKSSAAAEPLGNGRVGRIGDWLPVCAAAAELPEVDGAAARAFFERWFQPWKAGNNGNNEGLFTGYYEPLLNGARERGGRYTTPLLRRPGDLVMVELGRFRPAWRGERIAGRVVDGELRPYPTRAEIEAGALDRLNLAFLWVDDPIDAFFLEIQGSGQVQLADGSVVQLSYDGQNGRPYVPIGRLLMERGALAREDVSMQSIRGWILAHPDAAKALMDENPSYVFFRELAQAGPIGSGGVRLTAGRSLAVDRSFVPLGVPVWLDAGEDLRRLTVAQDTGGAIRGPVRGDVFWGDGEAAAERAGHMKAHGGEYLLLPKTLSVSPE
jgi:membrane-bound lytic murein transglycosylase A